MGRAKVVNYYNDRYSGKMSEDQCDMLESIIELDSCNGSFSDLKHIIRNVSDSDVTTIIEDYENFGSLIHNIEKPWGSLRDEQTLGAAFMFTAKKCILGDSVGMGKTVETAATVNLISSYRAQQGKKMRYLVLTQKNLAEQFRAEMIKFTGEYVTLINSGEQKVIDNFVRRYPYDVELEHSIVGTHALLTTKGFIQWLEQCRTMGYGFPFDTLVIDESSLLGGTNTQIVNGYKAISKYFENIYFLNATPFETQLQIFYNQINLIDPDLLPTKQNFTKEFCLMDYRGMYPKPTGKYKNQEQFKKLVAYRYFARTRRSKGATMENCDGKVILSPLSPIQKEWLNKSQLHRVIYDCPSHIDPSIEFNSENVPKLGSLNELLKNECADAETIIIFVHYKEAQKHLSQWLSSKGYSNRILNGDTDNSLRQTIIHGFKNGDFRVLITNVQKGLNFGSCNYCIFYSFDPNPSHMIQFEGRITRDFDVIGKHIYVLCSRGEEYKTLNNVVRQRAKATSEFTNTDLSVIMDILLGERVGD
jgi:superfamily II DNA or RNA helicase